MKQFLITMLGFAFSLALPLQAAAMNVKYLHALSDFTGPLELIGVAITVDDQRNEVLVADNNIGGVRVFDANGMETSSFGDDARLGRILDLTLLDNGDIVLLTEIEVYGLVLLRCNYRGEPMERIAINGLPEGWGDFSPSQLLRRHDRLYLVSGAKMRVAVTDLRGKVMEHHDLAELMGIDAAVSGLGGFDVGPDGTFYFTVPTKFSAYRLNPRGTLESFGRSGSTRGKFGVVGDIAVDPQGRIFVVDVLRCVGLVFSPELELVTEFAGRGRGRGGLIAPRRITLSDDGKIYIAQQGVVRVFHYTVPVAPAIFQKSAVPAETIPDSTVPKVNSGE